MALWMATVSLVVSSPFALYGALLTFRTDPVGVGAQSLATVMAAVSLLVGSAVLVTLRVWDPLLLGAR